MKAAEIFFTLLVLSFIMLFITIAFGYDAQSSLFPLLAGGFSLFFCLPVLATEIFPKLRVKFETNFFEIKETKMQSESIDPVKFSLAAFWVLLLLFLIFFFGFLFSLMPWVFCYVRFQGKRSWLYAFTTSLGVWLFFYVLFLQIMDADLFEGILLGARI